MIHFNGFNFYILLSISVAVYQAVQTRKNHVFLFLAINSLFVFLFSYYSPVHLTVLMILTSVEYLGLLWILQIRSPIRKKTLAALMILLTVGAMSMYKYPLFKTLILDALPSLKPWADQVAFLGMSYLALRWIHLIVDTCSGAIEEVDLKTYLCYVLFFPSLVAGPIDRYQRFSKDLHHFQKISSSQALKIVERIITGAFKKTVIANTLLTLSLSDIDPTDLLEMSQSKILLSSVIYGFALYFDFSGYSDIAIGIGSLFGFTLPENFNRPYLSTNIQDFWNRWHMTFMDWLRDYIFFPLSRFLRGVPLLKADGLRNILAVTMTFLVAGVWHGSGVHLFWYGLYLAGGYIAFAIWRVILRQSLTSKQLAAYDASVVVRLSGTLVTFLFMTFAWFFYLDRLHALGILLGLL